MMKRFYMYKQSHTVQKAKQLALRFYTQKARNFTLRDFHEIFEIGIYIYTKSMPLCVTSCFYIQNAFHFEESTTICVTVSYIQKA